MRYFYVCPHCMAKVEFEEELLDQYMQCNCHNTWQFTEDTIMSEIDYKTKKTNLETQYRIELNHIVKCSHCEAEHPYQLKMINKWIDCTSCGKKFQCLGKNVYLK